MDPVIDACQRFDSCNEMALSLGLIVRVIAGQFDIRPVNDPGTYLPEMPPKAFTSLEALEGFLCGVHEERKRRDS